ncbi:Kelch motif family protein [Histomonas meleagridis]|uniref:Kelch motif family protein n=1 Tax=Histomonas meleagridis TaxID=135588 RepID=UPI003559D1CF|nr:Kelch motif family protein [Histomonas meleagridis]KAH0798835.1 Kelch motif family protein [Histomonas meleagridis]
MENLFDSTDPVLECNFSPFKPFISAVDLYRSGNSYLCIPFVFSSFSYEKDRKDLSWNSLKSAPFALRRGQSCTPVDENGFAFFGGKSTGEDLSNEMWIIKDDIWSPLLNTIPPRKYHAAVFIPTITSLLISGGYSNRNVLNDMYLFNIRTLELKQIELQNPIQLAKHSIVYLEGTKVCIIGGNNSNGEPNMTLYIIDVATNEVKEINSYVPFIPTNLHKVSYSEGMLIVTKNYANSETWIFEMNYLIWLKVDFSSYLSDVRFVFPNPDGFMLFDYNLTKLIRVYYRDINYFKDRLLSANIQSDLYVFDDEEQIGICESALSLHEKSLANLRNKITITKFNELQIGQKALQTIKMEKLLLGLALHEHNLQQQIESKKIQTRKLPTEKVDKTVDEVVKSLSEQHQSRKKERAIYEKTAKASTETINQFNQYQINYLKEPNLSNEPKSVLIKESQELSKKIAEQEEEIANLTAQLQQAKSKVVKYINSLVALTKQVEHSVEEYTETEKKELEITNKFIETKIKFNKFALKEVAHKKSQENVDELVEKHMNAVDENKRLAYHLHLHKRSKNQKLKQLRDEINLIFNKKMSSSAEGEIRCRKARSALFDISNWVNENAHVFGANYLVNSIEYNLSKMDTYMPELSDKSKRTAKKQAAFSARRAVSHNWDSMFKEMLDTLDSLEKMQLL